MSLRCRLHFRQASTRVLAAPANHRTGTIADVEPIIILMQENRSFDHYFGTTRGVRGFADPRAVRLPSGQSVWHQPDGSGYLLPFRPDVDNVGMLFLPDPPHAGTIRMPRGTRAGMMNVRRSSAVRRSTSRLAKYPRYGWTDGQIAARPLAERSRGDECRTAHGRYSSSTSPGVHTR